MPCSTDDDTEAQRGQVCVDLYVPRHIQTHNHQAFNTMFSEH